MFASFVLPVYFKISKIERMNNEGEKRNIIISLTTFPARIDKLWLVLETLLRQKMCADKVIVWLSEDQIKDKSFLPKVLIKYQKHNVEYRFVKDDLRSYKKFYYAFQEYPESLIVTVDDDILYDSYLIKELYDKYNSCPSNAKRVIARFGTIVTKDNMGHLLNYVNWLPIKDISIGDDYFFGSGGGTLFKPTDLYKDVCNKELFMSLCPLADDVWLNAMCRLGEVKILMCNNIAVFPINNKNGISLSLKNVNEDLNDKQISAVNTYYSKELNKTVF
jgi:hypothetical protein